MGGRGDGCVGGTGMRGVAAHLSARTGAPFAAMTATMPCEPIDDDSREGSRGGYVVPGEPNRSDSLLATRVRGAFDAAARTEDVTRARAVLSRQVHYTPGCDDDDELEPLAEVYSARGWRVRMGGRDDASIEGGSSAAGGSSTSAARSASSAAGTRRRPPSKRCRPTPCAGALMSLMSASSQKVK